MEYQPQIDPEVVTDQLRTDVERFDSQALISKGLNPTPIPDEIIFQRLLDVYACRVSDWQNGEAFITLKPNLEEELLLGYNLPSETESFRTVWVDITKNRSTDEYEGREDDGYTFVLIDKEQKPVIVPSNAPIRHRLLQLLLDGHMYS